MKSTIAQAYSLSSLRRLELLVNECSIAFTDAMNDMAGQSIDLSMWLQFYAFDVIGNITFSQTFGFLKDRKDSLQIIDRLEARTRYNSVIGQTPELHPWLLGNEKILNVLMAIPAFAKANPITTLSKARQSEVCVGFPRSLADRKMQMMFNAMSSHKTSDKEQHGDFLEFIRKVQAKTPDSLSDRDVSTSLFTNL
jgi:Cytochrome P450